MSTRSAPTSPSATSRPAGRAGGIKISYPVSLDGSAKFVPFAGAYGDYYFSEDDTALALTYVDVIDDVGSARFTGGFNYTTGSGFSAGVTGEIGGLGSDTR